MPQTFPTPLTGRDMATIQKSRHLHKVWLWAGVEAATARASSQTTSVALIVRQWQIFQASQEIARIRRGWWGCF